MKRLATATLVFVIALTVACGGGGAETPRSVTGISTRVPEATPLAATPRPTAAAPSAASMTWAQTLCSATADFDEAVMAVQDEVDPRTLPVPDRRARGAARYEAYIEALVAGLETIQRAVPPRGASSYHAAVVAQYEELQRILQEQIERLGAAQSHEDIEASNALIALEVERLENSVRLAATLLDSEAIRALRAVPRCGQIIG